VKPQLTVFDPIYALMVGSMMADEPSGDFVRNMNFYQHVTGSAVLLLHHSHRPVRDKDGDKLDEGADSFFGSFIWKAYPRQFWMMRCDGPDNHYVEFMCAAQRSRKNRMGRLKMMMVEPSPLMFQPRMAGVGPTQAVILEELKLHPSTATSLVEVTQRTRSTVGAALTELVKGGIIIGDLAKPETFKRTTLELKPYKEREITSRPTLPSKAEPETK